MAAHFSTSRCLSNFAVGAACCILAAARAADPLAANSTASLLVTLAKDYGLGRDAPQSASDFLHVVTLLQAAVRLEPENADALAWLYEAQTLAGDTRAALDTLRRLVRADPDNHRAFEALLDATLSGLQTVDDRRSALNKLVQSGELSNPRQSAVYTRLVAVAIDSLDFDRARMALDRALAADPENYDAVHFRLQLAGDRMPPYARVKSALEAFQSNPLNVEAAWYLARLLSEYGFGAEAGRFFNHALEIYSRANPGQPVPADRLLDLALNAAARGNLDGAEELALQAVSAAPEFLPAQTHLFWILNKRGKSDEAAAISKSLSQRFSRIADLAAAPVDELAQAAWFYCLVDPRPRPALLFAQAASQRAPDDPFVKRCLGWAMALNQRLKDAGLALKDIATDDPFAAYQLARILSDNGEEAAARRMIDALSHIPAAGPAVDLLASLGPLFPSTQPAAKRFPDIADALTDFNHDLLLFHKESSRFLKVDITPDNPNFSPGEPWWATFTITNEGPFPVTLGADWMVNPIFLVSFEIEGDKPRSFPNQFTVALDSTRVIRPGQSIKRREALDLGPIRRVSRMTPQQLLRISCSAIFDPHLSPEGHWVPSLTGQHTESVVFNRVPVRTGVNGLQSLFAAFEAGEPHKRLASVEVLAQLLSEAQRAALKKMPYDPARVPEARIRQALLGALQSGSWELRARTLDALTVAGLDEKMLELVRRCLRHDHWLVRLMAVRLLGEREGQSFAPSAKTLLNDDPDELVRNMARSYLERWFPPTSQIAP